jgi:hypothetical protein
MMISLFSGFGIREKEKYQRVLCVKKRESVDYRRFLPGDFHKVDVERVVGRGKQSPENFWGSCFLMAKEGVCGQRRLGLAALKSYRFPVTLWAKKSQVPTHQNYS